MDPFPELITTRLKLRKLQPEDVPSLVKYANNKNISDNILNIPYPYREPDAVFRLSYVYQGFKNKSRYVFAITLKEPNELIGEISLHLDSDPGKAQLGYWVAEPFRGKGIATEAARAILRFGFEKLSLTLVYATCYTENTASEKVLLNTGMIRESVNGNVMLYNLAKQGFDNLPLLNH